jgi:hypothetical protein
MTKNYHLKKLSKLAKNYARANEIAHHKAIDLIAAELGFAHWNALIGESKKGWQPSDDDILAAKAFVKNTVPIRHAEQDDADTVCGNLFSAEEVITGSIKGETYQLLDSLGDVHIYGEGWHICVPENPNSAPIIEIDQDMKHSSAMNDPEIVGEALEIGKKHHASIRSKIATDWPRRSTMPDAKGFARHPIFTGPKGKSIEADTWYCLRCDGEITGPQIAKNLWHCPACGASPIDIHKDPFWLNEEREQAKPVDASSKETLEPIVRYVQMKLRLDLNSEKITLLIRASLIEDATNAKELLGALSTEIRVDEDHDVWISFDVNFWPEDKEAKAASTVAKLLGIEVFEEMRLASPAFDWPDLGEQTSSTVEYTKMLLDAYAQYASKQKD